MATTTNVVQRKSFWDAYRRHGYFFREAAMLTIAIGFCMHLYRVIFGDAWRCNTRSRGSRTSC